MSRALCIALALVSVLLMHEGAAQSGTNATNTSCVGRFPDPITDICWSCIFPMSIGDSPILTMNQDDMDAQGVSPICVCENTEIPAYGLSVGFFEPAIMAEVVRKPFCFPGLGGVQLSGSDTRPAHGRNRRDNSARTVFYQAHWYGAPLMDLLQSLFDAECYVHGSVDATFITEIDPTWNDDEWNWILAFDAALFANPIAQAACAADCIAASVRMPLPLLFWCAGCQGGLYPLNGWVHTHQGLAGSSALVVQKLATKLHRQSLQASYYGSNGWCSPWTDPIPNRQQYKMQMVYPVPNTNQIGNQCCQPFGRTTWLWGLGKEFPIQGEDAVYQLFRKRDCCITYE